MVVVIVAVEVAFEAKDVEEVMCLTQPVADRE